MSKTRKEARDFEHELLVSIIKMQQERIDELLEVKKYVEDVWVQNSLLDFEIRRAMGMRQKVDA